MILSPSILSADFSMLGEQIKIADEAGAEYIHLDVMDGDFVPSISFGMPVIASLRKTTKKVFDVHLMIKEPIRYIEEFVKAGADLITVHFEACEDLEMTINKIKSYGVKCAVAINPETSVKVLLPYLEDVDMILIMTVNPGFGGQKYIDSCTDKIKQLREMLDERDLDTDIEVDGGIKLNNVRTVLNAGANVIVAGSAVFGGDIAENVKEFQHILKEHEQ